jgi:hypothetical protein
MTVSKISSKGMLTASIVQPPSALQDGIYLGLAAGIPRASVYIIKRSQRIRYTAAACFQGAAESIFWAEAQ